MHNLPKILLSVESSRGFGRDLLTGISDFTRIYNPWITSRKPPFFRHWKADAYDFNTIKNELDGAITRIPEEIPIIQQLGIPAIVATVLTPPNFKLDPHYPTITSDNEAIARVAMDYFISQGFSNVAYCGFGDVSWSIRRKEAFSSYAKGLGYQVSCYGSSAGTSWEEEIQIITDWLKALPKPVAVLACSDERGEDVIEAAKIALIRIPEEVAVLGIDDDKLICNLSSPPLSSIVLNTQKIGFQAAELLNRLVKGEDVMTGQRLLLQPLYVEVRESTDILAIDDPEVACALGFIRQKFREAIQVQDVVDVTGISRRALEGRFRKTLNRTIQQELRRVRVKFLAKMVCETNMSIKSIAMSLGFTSIDHISRYFKKEKGISLHQYREKYGNV